MKVCVLFLLLFSSIIFADDKSVEITRKGDYAINTKYRAGPYLIFDCKGKYYACVDDVSNENCAERRKESIAKGESFYPCAPLSRFDDKEKCLHKNYDVIESVATKKFCYPKKD